MIGRRTLLSAAAAALAAPAAVSGVGAQSAFEWKQCKGQTIVVSLTKNPRADNLQAHQKEFEELTGIKVISEQIPEQQQRPKMVLELASGNPSFDVSHFSLHVSKRMIGMGKWMEDLRPYLNDPKLTAPDYDFADMSGAAMAAITQPGGRIDSLPLEPDVWLLFYNKRLLQEKGLGVPKTLDEMLATARKLNDPANGVYGFVGRGVKNANVLLWTNFLLGQGQETVTPDGTRLLTDTPEAIWAAQFYKDIMRECTPPGVVGFNWNESQTSFMQDKIGMWIDGIGFAPPLLDPKVSKISDHVGFAVMPAGPKAHHCSVTTDGIAIPVKSKMKKAAYLYCQWATGKKMSLNMVNIGGGVSPRMSTLNEPGLQALTPDWLQALRDSVPIGRLGLPEISPVSEFRDTFGIALTNMIQGADPAAELRKATEAFKPVLEASLKG